MSELSPINYVSPTGTVHAVDRYGYVRCGYGTWRRWGMTSRLQPTQAEVTCKRCLIATTREGGTVLPPLTSGKVCSSDERAGKGRRAGGLLS